MDIEYMSSKIPLYINKKYSNMDNSIDIKQIIYFCKLYNKKSGKKYRQRISDIYISTPKFKKYENKKNMSTEKILNSDDFKKNIIFLYKSFMYV